MMELLSNPNALAEMTKGPTEALQRLSDAVILQNRLTAMLLYIQLETLPEGVIPAPVYDDLLATVGKALTTTGDAILPATTDYYTEPTTDDATLPASE